MTILEHVESLSIEELRQELGDIIAKPLETTWAATFDRAVFLQYALMRLLDPAKHEKF